MTSRSSDTRAHPTAGRRRLSALVACLAFVFCCGQAAATSFQHIPLGNAVRDADVVVLGEVAVKEPLDPEHDVLVIKVGEMLKGDVAGKATIRVVSPGGGIVVGFHGFKEGQQGIWLITKMKNRDAYYITMHPVHFQPTTAQEIVKAKPLPLRVRKLFFQCRRERRVASAQQQPCYRVAADDPEHIEAAQRIDRRDTG